MTASYVDCEQGSGVWLAARMGIPTASQASRIITPTGKPSSAQRKYLAELACEWALGESSDEFAGTEWTERGKMLEPEARKFFTFETNREVRQIGLVYKDSSRTFAASPDGIIDGDTEGATPLELKCARPATHLLWLSDEDLPREHMLQVQAQIWTLGGARRVLHVLLPGASATPAGGRGGPAHP